VTKDDDLLTTGEVAELLRCSRQHVVDLCDRNVLPCVRVGVHRRIPRREVEALIGPPERREDERSLWLNHAFAAKLVADPAGIIERAKERLQRLRSSHSDGRSDVWFDRWQVALDAGPDAVLAIMTGRSDQAATMRSTSPFSGLGLLTDEERERVLNAFREHWYSSHRARAAA
jgi:excisionase family DNA binding protein